MPASHPTTPDSDDSGISSTLSKRSDMESENSSDSNSSDGTSLPLQSNPKKRSRPPKDEEAAIPTQSRVKRLRGCYNDKYRRLLNGNIKEIAIGDAVDDKRSLETSQNGVSTWSSKEKNSFFAAVARKGRHDLSGIAAAVENKCESEVHVYIQMLQDAVTEQQLYARREKLFATYTMNAAIEVGPECNLALNMAAEALSVLQQREEENLEKQEHAKLWLLTPTVAKWAEQCLRHGPEGEIELEKSLPAANLLHLNHFLCISKSFFMNSAILENNWRSYAGRIKAPTIMYSAFSDFHTLATSITKRLVQTSLFFAMSRLRAVHASSYYPSKREVKRQDVVASLNVLGMEHNARIFWARTARKCKLRVFDNVRHRQVSGKKYAYADIENLLGSGEGEPERPSSSDDNNVSWHNASDFTSPGSGLDSSDSASDLFSESDNSQNLSNASDTTDISNLTSHHSTKKARKYHQQAQLEDTYAEALDRQASLAEENRLWEMLGRNPAEEMETREIELPEAPLPAQKSSEEVDDWRKWVDYAAEWERNEMPVPGWRFLENRWVGKEVDGVVETSSEDGRGENFDEVDGGEELLPEAGSDAESDGSDDSKGPVPSVGNTDEGERMGETDNSDSELRASSDRDGLSSVGIRERRVDFNAGKGSERGDSARADYSSDETSSTTGSPTDA